MSALVKNEYPRVSMQGFKNAVANREDKYFCFQGEKNVFYLISARDMAMIAISKYLCSSCERRSVPGDVGYTVLEKWAETRRERFCLKKTFAWEGVGAVVNVTLNRYYVYIPGTCWKSLVREMPAADGRGAWALQSAAPSFETEDLYFGSSANDDFGNAIYDDYHNPHG